MYYGKFLLGLFYALINILTMPVEVTAETSDSVKHRKFGVRIGYRYYNGIEHYYLKRNSVLLNLEKSYPEIASYQIFRHNILVEPYFMISKNKEFSASLNGFYTKNVMNIGLDLTYRYRLFKNTKLGIGANTYGYSTKNLSTTVGQTVYYFEQKEIGYYSLSVNVYQVIKIKKSELALELKMPLLGYGSFQLKRSGPNPGLVTEGSFPGYLYFWSFCLNVSFKVL